LTEADGKARVKIFCKEAYAQTLYDQYLNNGITNEIGSKDFREGQMCVVTAKTLDFNDKFIVTEEKFSKSNVIVPFREYSKDPSELVDDETSREFKVIITKAQSGDYYGSEKQTVAITDRENLNLFMKTDTWFLVKIVSLVKGGYHAIYNGTIKCFLPGSHAAANVIRDFNDYLNTELPVMIENYDSTNDLYIVSYKKYVKHTLPQRIHELEFGVEYTGILTNAPYPFGIFIEFQNYFTGLLHKTEVSDYYEFCKDLKAGQDLKFFVKDIVIKKGEPRIILTDSLQKVDADKLAWQEFKKKVEGQTLKYVLDKNDFSIEVDMPEENSSFKTDVSHLKGKIRIPNSGNVTIINVDIIRKNLKLDFIII
jgi:ribosomal protein S1